VFRTKDGGQHWENISANLPQAPVTYLQPVGNRLVVSTDVGVFITQASSIRWYSLGSGLPNAPVTWLRYVPRNDRLYAATFGRSVWSIAMP
jgi:ligand-binding sensor domain-containing protein